MKFIRGVHAGSVAIALSAPLVGLVGCDGGGSPPATVKEDPQEAAKRQKMIEDTYKSNPAYKHGPGQRK